jgi:hypothetical protein
MRLSRVPWCERGTHNSIGFAQGATKFGWISIAHWYEIGHR